MMLNSDDDESSSSSNPSPLTAPDAQLSCSRRLTPSNVIDFIYGNSRNSRRGRGGGSHHYYYNTQVISQYRK